MMTFYHPSRGHWVCITNPSEEILESYPAGTREIPNAPEGPHTWDDAAEVWHAAPAASIEELLEAERARLQLSFAQMLIGLVSEQWITEAEGEAWLTGTLPAAVLGLISTLPANQQFAAKARAIKPSVVMRNDPLVAALGAAQGKTAEELDTFFRTYAQV